MRDALLKRMNGNGSSAEMALIGKFHVLPDVRFYRRFHATSSSWARSLSISSKARALAMATAA